jgi:hypothetical protein
VKTIRKDKNLIADDRPFVLFVHMDEYQFATPTVLAIVGDSFQGGVRDRLRCSFLLTGVSPMDVKKVEHGYTNCLLWHVIQFDPTQHGSVSGFCLQRIQTSRGGKSSRNLLGPVGDGRR